MAHFAMKAWSTDPEPGLRALAHGLLHRELWKPLPLTGDDTRADELIHAARSVARVKGFDPDLAVLVDTSGDSAYRPFTGVRGVHGSGDDSIRLVDSHGRMSYIEDRSEVVKMLSHLQLPTALVDQYIDLTRGAIFYADPHICVRCRYRSTELLWQCPNCHEWNTFVEERIAPAKDTEATL